MPEIDKKTGRRIVPCRGCGEPMIFVVTNTQANMPVNVKPVTVAILKKGTIDVDQIVEGYIPHHSVCPNASEFRGRRAGTTTTTY